MAYVIAANEKIWIVDIIYPTIPMYLPGSILSEATFKRKQLK